MGSFLPPQPALSRRAARRQEGGIRRSLCCLGLQVLFSKTEAPAPGHRRPLLQVHCGQVGTGEPSSKYLQALGRDFTYSSRCFLVGFPLRTEGGKRTEKPQNCAETFRCPFKYKIGLSSRSLQLGCPLQGQGPRVSHLPPQQFCTPPKLPEG